MKILLLIILLNLTLFAGVQKVVFDLTSGKIKTIEKRVFKNIKFLHTTFKKENEQLKVTVVISGSAYKYFIEDLENSPFKNEKSLYGEQQHKTHTAIKELIENYDVVFEICSKGMAARNITAKSLFKEVTPIVNKYYGLIKWQNRGYAYIPVA
ncbi:MAG: hypothetical protein GQ570_08325 [Helicobacteraceae bacterium]|nr:hypothetical protein [Helicobacteraceae bacterium]